MRRRFSRITRRALVGAVVGLGFAAAAGVGLAQITAGSSPSLTAAGGSTTRSQSTSTQTAGRHQAESADEQDVESADQETETDVDATTSSPPTTTGDEQEGTRQEKVAICHKTGSSKHEFHTIVIASTAVAAHLAHGDKMGECAVAATTAGAPQGDRPEKQKHEKKAKAHKEHEHSASPRGHDHGGEHGNAGVHGDGEGN